MKFQPVDILYVPTEARHAYDPACPHCKPALLDPETGQVYHDGDPSMVGVMKVWNAAPFKERQAFISVTVDNSRDPRDIELFEPIMDRMEKAFSTTERSS